MRAVESDNLDSHQLDSHQLDSHPLQDVLRTSLLVLLGASTDVTSTDVTSTDVTSTGLKQIDPTWTELIAKAAEVGRWSQERVECLIRAERSAMEALAVELNEVRDL